jgi:hypothetical protein
MGKKAKKGNFSNFSKTLKISYNACKFKDLQAFLFLDAPPIFLKKPKSFVADSWQFSSVKKTATEYHLTTCTPTGKAG